MKKITVLTLAVLLVAGVASSCKKGEDDPFLSLRSRKARLAGDWTLTGLEGKQTETGSTYSTVTTSTLSGSVLTIVSAQTAMGNTVSTTVVSSYTQACTFEKDGTYTRTDTDDNGSTSITGTWIFAGKSKKNELKNKEALLLTVNTTSGPGSSSSYTGTNGQLYVLKRLSNKEMVVTVAFSETDGTTTYTDELTYTYSKN